MTYALRSSNAALLSVPTEGPPDNLSDATLLSAATAAAFRTDDSLAATPPQLLLPWLFVAVSLFFLKGCWTAAAGLVTNSIDSIVLTFQNQGSVLKKSAFSTNAQSRFASTVFDSVLGFLRLVRHT